MNESTPTAICIDCVERNRLHIGRPLGHDCTDDITADELERAWNKAGRSLDNIARCSCSNIATDTFSTGAPACEWCVGHESCAIPSSTITTGYFGWGGEYIAKCSTCSYVCAYWDCVCELDHECPANATIKIVDGTYANPAGYIVFAEDGSGFTGITLCTDCYTHDDAPEQDEPLGYWVESDMPWHCATCEALIVTGLTPEGVEYVREYIQRNTERSEVLIAWSSAFADELAAGF